MKIHELVIPVVFIGALALTHPARSETISIKGNSQTRVQGKCNDAGGAYFAPGSKGGTYGCLNQDGSGIVCGGKGDNYANTCDTWGPTPAQAPKPIKLPTRTQARALARKAVSK